MGASWVITAPRYREGAAGRARVGRPLPIVFSGVRFSVIVPLYNRPEEIRELLESLVEQTFQDFEVLVVEDGSERDARAIVEDFSDRLDAVSYTHLTLPTTR